MPERATYCTSISSTADSLAADAIDKALIGCHSYFASIRGTDLRWGRGAVAQIQSLLPRFKRRREERRERDGRRGIAPELPHGFYSWHLVKAGRVEPKI